MRRKRFLRRRRNAFASLLLAAGTCHAAVPAILDSHGPLSSSALHEADGQKLLLGGTLTKADEDAYLRLVNTGADPARIPGPERLFRAGLNLGGALEGVKTVLALPGYHAGEPTAFQPLNSPLSWLVYVRGPNKAAEACRKKGESLRSCEAYLNEREVVLAASADGGDTWEQKAVLVTAKDSGDGSGPASASALYFRGALVVYYSTSKQSFMKENLYRLRVTLEGKRLGDPEPVKLDGFTAGTSLENPQVVRLKCPDGEKAVFTMAANGRSMAALPLYWSEDGLRFKKVVESLVSSQGALYSPTQLPGPASVEECNSASLKGVASQRDLVWAEKGPGGWSLRREKVQFRFP